MIIKVRFFILRLKSYALFKNKNKFFKREFVGPWGGQKEEQKLGGGRTCEPSSQKAETGGL
jgi:hypothetical protein